ncbi:MAG TPA: hypothetical protein VF371_12725 [Candidatus Limnocylindrales bacterium]
MTPTIQSNGRGAPWKRLSRGDVGFALAVLGAYVVATVLAIEWRGFFTDRMMIVAERVLSGHLDSDALKGTIDTAEMAGRYYLAVGPLQLLAYIPFAAIPDLRVVGGYLTGVLFGIPAAWLALPLARAYGARGATAYWIAAFTAFGTLLFWASVFGNFYNLAHAESFLALTLFLIEWAGRRRPILLGVCLGLSFLARPTTVLAAIPFGLYLIWTRRSGLRAMAHGAAAFGLPIAGAIAVYGWFNWVRFGSPFETGYGISLLTQSLQDRRAQGLFSIVQISENLRLALLALPDRTSQFPFFAASANGMSMALVSPALVASLWAGFRDRTARLLWIAAFLVAAPVFLYYGGGFVQYGFRYSLDFTPFLVALMAIGSHRWIGWPEKLLVLVGIGSVIAGICWYGAM